MMLNFSAVQEGGDGARIIVSKDSVQTFITSNSDVACSAPNMFFIGRVFVTFIFLIMNQLNDVYHKRCFLGLTLIHEEAMNALVELDNLEEFSEEQQMKLNDALAHHMNSSGEVIDSRLTMKLENVHFGAKIGEGSFGTVWKGECNGRVCAIKTLR
jgi:hypothetical protein